MLKAVIFDLDDTLIDWSRVQLGWNEIILRQVDPVIRYVGTHGHTALKTDLFAERLQERIRSAWMSTAPPDWVAPHHQNLLCDTLAEFDVPVDEIGRDEIYKQISWGLIPGVTVFEDTEEVLKTLRDTGLKLGLLTNAAQPMWMRDVEIEELGIRDYFDVRVSAGDIGTLKPHPKPFNVVLDSLGVSPDETFYVGDRPQDDVRGAHAAGMRAVWVRRPHSSQLSDDIKPNAIIDSLRDLFATLDIWYPEWRA